MKVEGKAADLQTTSIGADVEDIVIDKNGKIGALRSFEGFTTTKGTISFGLECDRGKLIEKVKKAVLSKDEEIKDISVATSWTKQISFKNLELATVKEVYKLYAELQREISEVLSKH